MASHKLDHDIQVSQVLCLPVSVQELLQANHKPPVSRSEGLGPISLRQYKLVYHKICSYTDLLVLSQRNLRGVFNVCLVKRGPWSVSQSVNQGNKAYMGKNRHGGKIKGDTMTHSFLSCDFGTQAFLIMRHWDTSISYHATLGHKHKIWDPCIPLEHVVPLVRAISGMEFKDCNLGFRQCTTLKCVAISHKIWDSFHKI